MGTISARKPFAILLLVICGWLLRAAPAADWPMWRYDANRSAASPEKLVDELHLQWVRKLPPYRLAWPNEPRLHFDASYEPIVMGRMLFLGSANDGSVTAFDTETGKETWKFYTEGPVRFAPVAWKGNVYVGSDDGFLYCLNAADGSLRWKFRAAPKDRPDRRHLGNARLISFWPVRGGPVLVKERIYFGAGIWPTLGVFIVALEAKTGRPKWVNGRLNYILNVRIDHNTLSDTGLSPQGYFVVVDDKLLIPNGRSMPAGLDLKTGKLLYYVQGYRRGDCRVTGMGPYAFVGGHAVINTSDGREAGSRWVEAAAEAPDKFDMQKVHLFEGPMFGYKLFPGCDARSVLVPGAAYGMHSGTFYGHDLANAKTSEYEKEFHGNKLKPWRWDAPELWKLATEYAKNKPLSLVVIKAGERLYGHAGRVLVALDLPAENSKPRIAWQKELDGTPSSMLAADGRLFVVTKEGTMSCFGPNRVKPRVYDLETKPRNETDDKPTGTAGDVLEHNRVSEGYCVVLGLESGRLLEELLQRPEAKVIAIDPDRAKINALRSKLVAAGLYGTRVEAFVGKPFDFPFPPYLASLIVSEDPDAAGFSMNMPAKKLFEILHPYGGAAFLAIPESRQIEFEKWITKAKLQNAEVERVSGFAVLRRVGALPNSAHWTHEAADSCRSYFSKDELVKAPLGVLWYGDGSDYGFYKRKDYGRGVKPQVVGGRVFAIQMFSQTLFAYGVYTGRLLWKQKVDPFTRYASMGDGIYVAEGNCCIVYNPTTGEELATFKYETRSPAVVKDIRVSDDVIVIAVSFTETPMIGEGLWNSTILLALDRKTGEPLWKKEAKERFNNNALAAGDGMVFCVDSLSPLETDKAKRRGEEIESSPSTIMALNARSGEAKWMVSITSKYRTYGEGYWTGIRGNDDWLAYCHTQGLLLAGRSGKVHALNGKTGKEVWEQEVGSQPMILRGSTFISQAGTIYDTATGRKVGQVSLFKRGGCNYAVANEHLLMLRARTASYIDIDAEKGYQLRNIRSGCSNSLIAADGVLNVPNFAVGCVCNYPIQTSFAMVYMPEASGWAGATPTKLPGRH